jgi:hypothetical protein
LGRVFLGDLRRRGLQPAAHVRHREITDAVLPWAYEDLREAHGLVWIDVSDGELRVTNVTLALGELSIEGYNAVLRELHDEVCAPAAAGLDEIEVVFDDGEDALRERVPPEVAEALEAFACSEEGGFSFDVAERLAEEYGHARELLKRRDQDAA